MQWYLYSNIYNLNHTLWIITFVFCPSTDHLSSDCFSYSWSYFYILLGIIVFKLWLIHGRILLSPLVLSAARHASTAHSCPPPADGRLALALHRVSCVPRCLVLPLPGRYWTSRRLAPSQSDPPPGHFPSACPRRASGFVPMPVQCPSGKDMEQFRAQPTSGCNRRYTLMACVWCGQSVISSPKNLLLFLCFRSSPSTIR